MRLSEHGLEDLAHRRHWELVAKLEAQLAGRATKTTAASKDRAEKLRAVAALLGGRK